MTAYDRHQEYAQSDPPLPLSVIEIAPNEDKSTCGIDGHIGVAPRESPIDQTRHPPEWS